MSIGRVGGPQLTPERGAMLVVAGGFVAGSLLGAGLPILVSLAIDRVAAAGFAGRAMAFIVAAILLVGVGSWAIDAVSTGLTARTVGNVMLRLRTAAFDAVLRHNLSFYDANPTGKIISRLASDAQLCGAVVGQIIFFASEMTLVVLMLVYLVTVDPVLSL